MFVARSAAAARQICCLQFNVDPRVRRLLEAGVGGSGGTSGGASM